MNDLVGFLLINKPRGMSSYDCINYLKRILNKKIKIGHAGTLDPFATGLLIIAIGRVATREISKIMGLKKEYAAKGKLGELTDTLDFTGTIIQTKDVTGITKEQIEKAITLLGDSYEQIPPIYSALKHEGMHLYKLARRGVSTRKLEQIAEQKKRIITLYELVLTDFSLPFFSIRALVSHGTYIRSLVNDIAKKAGSFATTYSLTRTKIGAVGLADAISIDELKTVDDIVQQLIDVSDFLEHLEHMDDKPK